MSVVEKHLEDLRKSGLTDAQIEAAEIFSTADAEEIACLLNWNSPAKVLGECCVIPYLGLDGRPTGYHRIKPNRPRRKNSKRTGEKKTLKYEAPVGEQNRAYFPPGSRQAISDPTARLIITEGEKKALRADQSGFATIGIAGVWNWQRKRERDNDDNPVGERELIPDLANIQWQGREVLIVFDSDSVTNPNVRFAESELQMVLARHGANVFIVRLPSGPGGKKVGLDDYLLTHKKEELQELIDQSTSVDAGSDLDRLLARIDQRLEESPGAIFQDRSILHEAALFSVMCPANYASVKAHLKAKKVSVRDFERSMAGNLQMILEEMPNIFKRDDTGGYFIDRARICRAKMTPHGKEIIALCNFTAEISAEIILDDGVEQQTYYEIEGQLSAAFTADNEVANGRKLRKVRVPAKEFDSMKWVFELWGADTIIYANEHKQIGPAIRCQTDRRRIEHKRVCTHTGWKRIGDDWVYLHAGGVVGHLSSLSSVSVALEPPLNRYCFPEPKEDREEISFLTRVLSILLETDDSDDSDSLAHRLITLLFILISTVFRAAIHAADFGLHLAGPSGVFKSEVAALMQQFFGLEMAARHLPGSWSSTANANELLAFLSKDALLVIDDFAPTGADVGRMHRDADRLFRNQGNNAARGRMNADGTQRPPKPPRGLILSTGEDVPIGHSLRARSLILEIEHGLIPPDWLTERQAEAAAGVYAGCMRGFLEHLSLDYEAVIAKKSEVVAKYRNDFAQRGLHARTPAIAAELLFGFRLFLRYALAKGAINEQTRDQLIDRCMMALTEVAKRQATFHMQSEPVRRFLPLLSSVLTSGRAHFAAIDGSAPDFAADYGWRKVTSASGESHKEDWRPNGRLIGWVDPEAFYIEPDAAYAEVCSLAREQGDPIVVTKDTLWKRMDEQNYLAAKSLGRLKYQKRIQKSQKWVIAIKIDAFHEAETETE